MDSDREYARLVRESGLVPAERVRDALRRVERLRAKGDSTVNLLRELQRQGQLDDAGTRRIQQLRQDEQARAVTAKTVQLRASERKREPTGGWDRTTPGRLSEPERAWLREQAYAIDREKIIGRDELRRAYQQVAKRRAAGESVDLPAYLLSVGAISRKQEQGVRDKLPAADGPPARLIARDDAAGVGAFPSTAVVGSAEPPDTPGGPRTVDAAQRRPAALAGSPALALRHRDRLLASALFESGTLSQEQLAEFERRIDETRRRGQRTDLAQEVLNAELLSWQELAPMIAELPRVPGDRTGSERLREAAAAKQRSESGTSQAGHTPPPLAGGPLDPEGASRVRRVPAGEAPEVAAKAPVRPKGKPPANGGADADDSGAVQPADPHVTYIPRLARPLGEALRARLRPADGKPKPRDPGDAPRRPSKSAAAAGTTVTADPHEPPVGALDGDVGEDRLSVRRMLGLRTGVNLRDESVESWAGSELGASSDVALPAQPPAPAAPWLLAERRSKYKLMEPLGRGGMGTVVRAHDRDIRRTVAMKRLDNWRDREAMERFVEEAQVTGQLEHPNIVPVHDLGLDHEGRLFFTMKYVHGESLASILEQIRKREDRGQRDIAYRGFDRMQLLHLFLKVCDAIAFAHAKGVIHRDLKPENVMVGAYGEVLVMDWGVAKLIEPRARKAGLETAGLRREAGKRRRPTGPMMATPAGTDPRGERVRSSRAEDSALQSQAGDVLGTASYMSPEQARGEVKGLDERTDVYALGAMLYELLTLQAPFDGRNVFMILRAVIEQEVEPPRQRAPQRNVPPALEAVVLRAMAKARGDRFASVDELKDAVLVAMERGDAMGSGPPRAGTAGREAPSRTRLVGLALALLTVFGAGVAAGVAWMSCAV